ncbi:MAG: hypothetical protein CL607_13115 [Anaerolineaceae bacterium]|nr:hypothetical protein [Anaerolineaceae bacterium]
MWKLLVLALMALALAACEAEATPAAVVVPDTPTAAPSTATAAPPLRYGLLPNTEGFIAADERTQLAEFALVEQIQQTSDSILAQDAYDIIAGYGTYDGWERSATDQTVLLIVNTTLSPLDDPEIVDAIIQNSRAENLVRGLQSLGATADDSTQLNRETLRALLANKGYPDGIVLNTLLDPLPGFDAWTSQLADANVTLQTSQTVPDMQALLDAERFHLAFVNVSEAARAELIDAYGSEHVIELYTLPISYELRDSSISVTFTDTGWPIPQRTASTASVTPTPTS